MALNANSYLSLRQLCFPWESQPALLQLGALSTSSNRARYAISRSFTSGTITGGRSFLTMRTCRPVGVGDISASSSVSISTITVVDCFCPKRLYLEYRCDSLSFVDIRTWHPTLSNHFPPTIATMDVRHGLRIMVLTIANQISHLTAIAEYDNRSGNHSSLPSSP
jgi:hypothetical protein